MGQGVKSFEDLVVYQRTRLLVKEVYTVTRLAGFRRDFGLVDQIRRAAVSILSNIAEGFERGGNSELIHFLYIAKGSCGEVRAQLVIAADQEYIDVSHLGELQADCRRISAMLNNLIGYLRRSPMRGHKYALPKLTKDVQAVLSHYLPDNPKTSTP